MTDPSTPDRPGENDPNPSTPGSPPPPAAPAWGAPPPPPSSPPASQQPGPQQPGRYDAPQQPPSAYPSPQQGGFPPPPSSGFPPPPQQGAGFPPPPQGYGQPGGYQAPSSDIGVAFGWGWQKFKSNAGPLILSILLWGIGIALIAGIGFALAGAVAGTSSTAQTEAGFAAATSFGIGGIILVSILTFLAAFVAQVALTNGYLAVADRGHASLGDFFKFRHIGQGILLALLLGLASGLLSWTGIGSLAVAFFGAFAIFFVVDKGIGAIDAIKASVRLALDNAGVTIVAILVSYAGALVCGVGALVTAPLASLVLAYVYRRVTGGRVAA
ncbi:hypothetical protein [Serinibacter arcticus]|uniref:Integral membrane protein n=1 Tax=Serinibacter arcticus TaxID=1655435 RepID=A0A4Z1E407_9MICO|nr:hypothetical protein [Serinibacter arcticus]TGO04371.1 hypothetical protein SERN_1964 [Serinibacter arcticus]